MKINIKGIIKKNKDFNVLRESVDYYDKLINIIEPPYFRNLEVMGIPEDQYETIFSKLFNQPVKVGNNEIFNENGKTLYYESYQGEWLRREYDGNGNINYYENSNGYWRKTEYDNNGNRIYYEDSNGFWSKREYDDKGNEIYFENSNGRWEKREYDENGYRIYFEDSDGTIIDRRNNNLNESVDYYDKLLNVLQPPYFRNLETMGISEDQYETIFSKLYGEPVSKYDDSILNEKGYQIYYEDSDGFWNKYEYDNNGKEIYYEDSDGYWVKKEYDNNGNQIYSINSNGFWIKKEYDDNGNNTYVENSDGYWVKKEYDDNGNQIYVENSSGYIIDKRNNGNINESVDYYDKLINILEVPYFQNLRSIGIDEYQWDTIFSRMFGEPVNVNEYGNIKNKKGSILYYENSKGYWIKYEYDDNGNEIYFEDSKGIWYKKEYDDNGKPIYYEDSKGYWEKWEYDDNGKEIYYETSSGYIIDRRNNNLNESVDYYSKLINIIEPPYFRNLETMGISEDQYETIFSKIFNQPVSVQFGYDNPLSESHKIFNDNGKPIYFEDSDGYWRKTEYNDNGIIIFYVNSFGEWYKNEFDDNGDEIYYEDSKGRWVKREYDDNGNEIYYENSIGEIRDYRNNGNINESVDNDEIITNKLIEKLIHSIEPPYFESLKGWGIDPKYYNYIFEKIFGTEVKIINGLVKNKKTGEDYYFEMGSGEWYLKEFNENGQMTSFTNSIGQWVKNEYDENGNQIYSEDSRGYWDRRIYNEFGDVIYRESDQGVHIDNRPNNLNESVDYYDKIVNILEVPYFRNLETMGIDPIQYDEIMSKLYNQHVNVIYKDYYKIINGDGNEIYNENSKGFWVKYEYDLNGNEIYSEDSNGGWTKKEYDSNNKMIYYENSSGYIVDKRNNGNINESVDYYDKLINILEKPYFSNLLTMGISDEQWDTIFSKIYNQRVFHNHYGPNHYKIYDQYGMDIYSEVIGGRWVSKEFDDDGFQIYYENSDGEWEKTEYNENGYIIYVENSKGYWEKREYDDNEIEIYYEDSNGDIIDNRNKSINESVDHYDKLVSILKRPYFRNLETMGIDEDYYETLLPKLFNQPVTFDMDDNPNTGYWRKRVFNDNGEVIYYEDSNGEWFKQEFDDNGDEIYYEDSKGRWVKREYDDNGNEIYFENSNGRWEKREFDNNNNLIYYEDSNGTIEDKRNNNINESKGTNYYERLLNILEPPYFITLDSMGFNEEETEDIIKKIFGDSIIIERSVMGIWVNNSFGDDVYYEDLFRKGYWYKKEYNENNQPISYINSDDFWIKWEYDSKGNIIYKEDSSGKIEHY